MFRGGGDKHRDARRKVKSPEWKGVRKKTQNWGELNSCWVPASVTGRRRKRRDFNGRKTKD